MKQYYSLVQEEKEAFIQIYGDITSWPWLDSDVSSYTLSNQINRLEVDVINAYINSYGGEVGEGLAIYNNLKRHKARVRTYCDGFACSIASVIFMAGEDRIMSDASLLMIHNAWTNANGNADDLRKQAADLDVITQASVNAYLSGVTISEEELKALLNAETWITPQDAVIKGFATKIETGNSNGPPSQNARSRIIQMIQLAKASPGCQTITSLKAPQKPLPGRNEEPPSDTENKPLNFLHALMR